MENGSVRLRAAALERVNDGASQPTIPSPQDSVRFETGAEERQEGRRGGTIPPPAISRVRQEMTPRRTAYSTSSAVPCTSSFCRMWVR